MKSGYSIDQQTINNGDRRSTISFISIVNDIRHNNPAKRPSVAPHAAAKAVYHVTAYYVSYGADFDVIPDSDAITAVADNSAAVIRSTQQMPHSRQSTDSGTASIATSCSSSTNVKDP
jgi:hypothetical protein